VGRLLLDYLAEAPEGWIRGVQWLAGQVDPLSQEFRPQLDTAAARYCLEELRGMAATLQVGVDALEGPPESPADWALRVEGAGTEWLNGVYKLEGEWMGFPKYVLWAVKPGYGTTQPVSIYRAKMKSGGHCWFIGIMHMSAPGTDNDQDYYKSEEFSSASLMQLPPRHHTWWRHEYPLGKLKVPTVTKVHVSALPVEEEQPAGAFPGEENIPYNSYPSRPEGCPAGVYSDPGVKGQAGHGTAGASHHGLHNYNQHPALGSNPPTGAVYGDGGQNYLVGMQLSADGYEAGAYGPETGNTQELVGMSDTDPMRAVGMSDTEGSSHWISEMGNSDGTQGQWAPSSTSGHPMHDLD